MSAIFLFASSIAFLLKNLPVSSMRITLWAWTGEVNPSQRASAGISSQRSDVSMVACLLVGEECSLAAGLQGRLDRFEHVRQAGVELLVAELFDQLLTSRLAVRFGERLLLLVLFHVVLDVLRSLPQAYID